MSLTPREQDYLVKISKKLKEAQNFLNSNILNEGSIDSKYWYKHIVGLKRIMGNLNNDVSFVACLMVKEFLTQRHQFSSFDIAAKSQSAPGLDIDERTDGGERVIAEIKTTIPYGQTDLGAQQKNMFFKDFEKLAINDATHKYFFVTERESFEIVKKHYLNDLKGVTVVLLPHALEDSGNEDYIINVPLTGLLPNEQPSTQFREYKVVKPPEFKEDSLSDTIRIFIRDNFIIPARTMNKTQIRLRSGDVHSMMKLRNRYPAVCSAMKGYKIEQLCSVKILNKEGQDGANFYVTYAL